jgi:hypothetical protein
MWLFGIFAYDVISLNQFLPFHDEIKLLELQCIILVVSADPNACIRICAYKKGSCRSLSHDLQIYVCVHTYTRILIYEYTWELYIKTALLQSLIIYTCIQLCSYRKVSEYTGNCWYQWQVIPALNHQRQPGLRPHSKVSDSHPVVVCVLSLFSVLCSAAYLGDLRCIVSL